VTSTANAVIGRSVRCHRPASSCCWARRGPFSSCPASSAIRTTRERTEHPWDPLAGWNTFSAFEADGVTVAQVQVLMRADDPLYELGMLMFAHRMENRHWQQTLHNLAAHFGVHAPVQYQTLRLDRRRQWSRAANLWYNAAVRSALHTLAVQLGRKPPTSTPVRHH
jgi:hypothetical protein